MSDAPIMHPSRILLFWYGLMIAGGFLFGLLGDRRPFGPDMLAHPLVVFFAIAAAALLVLRIALAQPVPELIPERPLIAGCILGAGAFLAGNFIATRVLLVA
jgi:hypothetical protein